jgi:flagellar biosynthetic protein FlhB
MADQPAGEKILPASPRKLERAREKGNVAKSSDLTAGVLLLAAGLTIYILGPASFGQLLLVMQYYFGEFNSLPADRAFLQPLTAQAVLLMAPAVIPLMLVLAGVGALTNIVQFGFIFSGQALQPRADRINPIRGFQRLFSLRAFVELIKSIVKLTVIGLVVYWTVRGRVPEMLDLMHSSAWGAAIGTWQLVWAVWWRVALAMIAIGILDFAYQRWQYLQDQRMTRQEAQEELRQLEGDPRIRQRVRQIQRQMAMRRMMAEVPKADVVITNPTTYAVALRYDALRMDAPRVVAKGMRNLAERIRELAIEHSVPIVERPELARLLYRDVDLDQRIPDSLFRAVAEVLAYVYAIDRRAEKLAEREIA